ncbi:MAG: hypothetical protein AAGE05_06495 [Pseudomonadota bacterium]
MDAPPTQYRVIERGRKLIVLDSQTNLPPKQACEIHPTGHYGDAPETSGTSHVETATEPEDRPPKRDRPRDTFEDFGNAAFLKRLEGDGLNPASIGIGAFGFAMVLAIMIGGFTGFLMAAAAIIIAGNIAIKKVGKRR